MRDLFGVLLRFRTGSCRVGDCSTWSLWMVAGRRSCGGILAGISINFLFAGRRSCDGILAGFLSISFSLDGGVVTASWRDFYQFPVRWTEELWRHPGGISINFLFAGRRSCDGILAGFLSISCSLDGGVVTASWRDFYQFPVRWTEELWRHPGGISINFLFAGRRSCDGFLAGFLSISCFLGEGVVAASWRDFYQFPVSWEKELWRHPGGISINFLFADGLDALCESGHVLLVGTVPRRDSLYFNLSEAQDILSPHCRRKIAELTINTKGI